MGALLEALHTAVDGRDLTETEASQALDEILSGDADPGLIGALLTALRVKGETVDEIVGFARAMRSHAAPVRCDRTDPLNMVDTCGTGGDGLGTFNISTVSAFVVAGAGVPVAKHGNRSISSQCGSADVLEAAGANVQLTPEQAAEAIDEVGVGFLFAPLIHPAMKHVQPVRRALAMRTVFNMLGPLTNPANAGAQVVGVFDGARVLHMAQALSRLGVQRAFVVHGEDGLDEITTTSSTRVGEVSANGVTESTLTPEDFGVEKASPEDLAGGDRESNALTLQRILQGAHGPQRDIVIVNAAAALVASQAASDFRAGSQKAAESIDSGAASDKLRRFIEFTDQFRAE